MVPHVGVEVRLADIDQEGLASPTAAPVHAGPPTGCKIRKALASGPQGVEWLRTRSRRCRTRYP
eukprot:8868667-Alexandrium_andersonii.AAC.1